ncbi:MAG: hypothetical protein K0B15_14915 [Lentimicrobium sp.]|nr:hypothetical protein [Lentimicrobium sp.]
MTHQKLLNEIRNNISDLNRILEHLSNTGEVHLIDADILLEMMRDIYLKTSLLKEKEISDESPVVAEPAKVDSPEFFAQTPVSREKADDFSAPEVPVIPKPEVAIEEVDDKIMQQESSILSIKAAVIDLPEPEKKSAPTQMVFAPPVTNSNQAKPAVQQPDLFGNGTLSEKFKTEAPSLNDIISPGKSDHTLADKINLTPISDIKNAIGINEKFQFINELFEGSAQHYKDTIAVLNNCIGIEAARELFADFQSRNNWDTKNKAYLKLKEYIERRYLIN